MLDAGNGRSDFTSIPGIELMASVIVSENDHSVMRDFAGRWIQAQPAVAAFIWSLVPSGHDADDILQRTAKAIVENLHKYDESQSFTAWAIGIAKFEVLRFRQERRRDRLIFETETIETVAGAYQQAGAELSEMKLALNGCIEKLSGRIREIVQLYYLKEHSPAEIARQLGTTENAVFVSLHRARAALRICMESQREGSGR